MGITVPATFGQANLPLSKAAEDSSGKAKPSLALETLAVKAFAQFGTVNSSASARQARPVAPGCPGICAREERVPPPEDSVSLGPAPIFPEFFR